MRATLFARCFRLRPTRPSLSPLRRGFCAAATPRPVPDIATESQQCNPEQRQQDEQQQQQQQQPSPPPPENDNPPPSQTSTATPHPSNPTLIYPSAPSPHHNDLASFLAYAARTNLDPASTVYVGTHFEYTTCAALARYGFALRRVGGASDFGIDLLGTWSLPPSRAGSGSAPSPSPPPPPPPPLRVLAQCKAVQKPGPHLIRELEGAFVGAPAGWRGPEGVLGLLVTVRPATKGIREALGRSRWPMGFVACSREGRLEQVLWNRRAEEEGLEGLGVGIRYMNGGQGGKELVLTWKGRSLPLLGEGSAAG